VTTYLVTGGAGFIGSHLVERLVADGETVRILDNLSTGSRANIERFGDRVTFLEGDLQDPAAVERAVAGAEIVFHQAALASVPLSVEQPLLVHGACATGTVVLLDACRKAGVKRVVYAGPSSCYGDNPVTPKSEHQVPEVISPYGAAKLAGEYYVEAFAACYPLETVRLRYFNVFGPRQDPGSPYSAVIPLFVSALLQGRRPKIFGDGLQSRDFTYVANIVHANLLAARTPGISGRVYNIACGASLNLIDLLREICGILGLPYDPEFCPPRPGDIKHSWADISRAERDLGYTAQVDWKTGLKATVEYYREFYRRQDPQP